MNNAKRNSENCPFKVGARVTYKDVNLRDYRGTVTETMGDFVFVCWDGIRITKEWAPNLKTV